MRIKVVVVTSYKCNKHNIHNIRMKRFLTRRYDFIKKFDYRIINILKMQERKMIKLGFLSILVAASKRSFFYLFYPSFISFINNNLFIRNYSKSNIHLYI